jgi:pyruvate/2-oxoglutarate dehydrogenase complex dihydrolipoamide acyltransferase (E2) component
MIPTTRVLRLLLVAGSTLAPLGLTLGACGGGEKPPEAPATASASAAPSSSEPAASSAPPPAPAPSASSAPSAEPAPNPGSKKATKKTDASLAGCHQSYKAKNKDVSKDVAAMAKACESATKMKLLGKTLTGKQSDQQPPQTFPFKAEAKHCYRVYAQAADGIKDLDLAIKDSTGAIAGEDSTDDPSPVVLEDGAICYTESDASVVVVSVGMGSGAYAVQIWGD